MLNSFAAAVQTLEDANALAYTISQVPNFKIRGDADTVQNLLDKFQTDWDKLVPGVYRVDYSKSATDNRSGLCFRVQKVDPAAGSPAALAGIGGPGDMISGLQQQIWNLQTEARVRELQDAHREEIRKMKEKDGEDGLGGFGPLIAQFPRIENMIYMATGRAPLNNMATPAPAVAGPALPPASDGPDLNDNGQRLTVALDTLQNGLGGDLLVQIIEKLAGKDPDKLRHMAGMIDML